MHQESPSTDQVLTRQHLSAWLGGVDVHRARVHAAVRASTLTRASAFLEMFAGCSRLSGHVSLSHIYSFVSCDLNFGMRKPRFVSHSRPLASRT